MQIDRHIAKLLHYYHKSVVKHPGGIAVEISGRTIKPMTPALAAESAGMTTKDFGKRIDPNQQERPFLEAWARNLLDGMDTASLDALEAGLGRLAFALPTTLPEPETMMREAVKLGKEFGDVMLELERDTNPSSPEGIRLSRRESIALAQQLRELIARSCVMLHMLESQ